MVTKFNCGDLSSLLGLLHWALKLWRRSSAVPPACGAQQSTGDCWPRTAADGRVMAAFMVSACLRLLRLNKAALKYVAPNHGICRSNSDPLAMLAAQCYRHCSHTACTLLTHSTSKQNA